MFENLSQKLGGVLRSLTGRGRLTEGNIQEACEAVRTALLGPGRLGQGPPRKIQVSQNVPK